MQVEGQSGTALAKSATFVGAGLSKGKAKRGNEKKQGARPPAVQSTDAGSSLGPLSEATAAQTLQQPPARPPQPKPRPPVRPQRPEDITPLSRDLGQFRTRFPSTFITSNTDTLTTLRLSFAPTDPDFPYELEKLEVELKIPSTYPLGYPRLTVLTDVIPSGLRRKVESGWEKMALANSKRDAGSRLSLVGMINWLDRKLEELLVEEDRGAVTGVVKAGEGIGSGPAMEPASSASAPAMASESSEASEEEEGHQGDNAGADGSGRAMADDGTGPSDEANTDDELSYALSTTKLETPAPEIYPEHEEKLTPSSTAISTTHRGTHLRLPTIHSPGISLLQPYRLSLVLRCSRCRTHIDALNLEPDKPVILPCGTCRGQVGVKVRGSAIHAGDPLKGLAYLDLENCTVIDLLAGTSSYTPTCAGCSEPNVGLFKGVERNERISAFCRKCNAKMELGIGEVKFVRLSAGEGVQSGEERAGAGLVLKLKVG